MKTYPRSSRIGKNIQRGISEYLQNNLRDPRIRMVTITGVTMSPDLSVAYIYYNVNGGEREPGLLQERGRLYPEIPGRWIEDEIHARPPFYL